MSNTTLIQLAEENSFDNSSPNKKNGEWTNTLNDSGLTLEEGDMLSIKNAFIDSAPSGNIFLSQDTVATMQFNYYFNNHDEFPDDKFADLPPNVTPKRTYQVPRDKANIPQPDGLNYIVCKKTTGGANTITIDSVQFNDYGNDANSDDVYTYYFKVKGTGNKFLNCGEGPAKTGITIFPINRVVGRVFEAGLALSATQASNLFIGGNAVNFANLRLERSDGHDMSPSDDIKITKGELAHDIKLTPHTQSVSIKLKAGYYAPAHIAHLMTDQLNSATTVGNPQDEFKSENGIANVLYTSLQGLMKSIGANTDVGFSAMDGTNVSFPNLKNSNVDVSYDSFIGTNTFTFDYRADLGIPRMAISQNHSPIYQKALTGLKKIQYIKQQSGVDGNGNPFPDKAMTRYIGTSSGIIPVGVSATGVTDFWTLIGFDPSQFSPSIKTQQKTLNNTAGGTSNITMNVFDMDNITDHITTTYTALDVEVSKDDNDPTQYTPNFLQGQVSNAYTGTAWVPSSKPNDANVNDYTLNKAEMVKTTGIRSNVFIATTNITPIFANFPVERALQQVNPYYLININVMKGTNVGSQGENTTSIIQKFADISCVTGTYYNASSYTLSQPSDAIPYIHKGSPIALNNIKVRILDKNKNNNKACLNKSHVFLLLEKASPSVPKKK